MKRMILIMTALLIAAVAAGPALAVETGAYTWQGYTVDVTDAKTGGMFAPEGMTEDEYCVTLTLSVGDDLKADDAQMKALYAGALLTDPQRAAYAPGAWMSAGNKQTFLYAVPKAVSLEDLTLTLGGEAPASEEAPGEASFSWKGYEMRFPFMTADLADYGLESFQGVMALVRLAPAEGTFAYSDFKQQLFELVDADGNAHICKFFIVANSDIFRPTGASMPAAQQEYVDLLFEMNAPTAEDLAAASMNVYEAEGEEPMAVPLNAVPQQQEQ